MIRKTDPIRPSRRPAEIVRDYIETEFLRAGVRPETRLPTIHEFARHLNVGASTVRTVLKALAEEGKLKAVPGRGTFLTAQAETQAGTHHCLGVSLAAPLAGKRRGWGGAILLGLTEEALRTGQMVTTLDISRVTDARKALSRLDGVITFPSPDHSRELDRLCIEQKMPLVHVNPTHFHATANFVSNDFFKFAYTLALAWRECGRRRVAVAIGHPVNLSVSAAQVAAAFFLAYADCPDARVEILDEGLPTRPSGEARYYHKLGRRLIRRYLDKYGKNDLDAVYGFGDWTAEGAAQELLDAGKSIPGDVSVVGGTGMDAAHLTSGALVTMRQPMRAIGEAAVRMLLWRAQHKGLDAPGQYLMPALGEGTTLRAEEHEAFHQILDREKELV